LSLDDVESFDELLSLGVCTGRVALSLADLKSVESRRIGWLMAVHKRFSEEGGKLVVHSLRPLLMDALRFLRVDRVLHIAADEAAARRMLHQSEPVAAG
jgi:anti-anti-sigma regulatory factor